MATDILSDSSYVHKGIACRAFERKFTLSDDIVVKGCNLTNGMLTVELEKSNSRGKTSTFNSYWR